MRPPGPPRPSPLRRADVAAGMQTFDQHIFDLYQAGIIDYDKAIAYSDSPNDIRLRIKMSDMKTEEPDKKEATFKLKKDGK